MAVDLDAVIPLHLYFAVQQITSILTSHDINLGQFPECTNVTSHISNANYGGNK